MLRKEHSLAPIIIRFKQRPTKLAFGIWNYGIVVSHISEGWWNNKMIEVFSSTSEYMVY
jgi:hypothetical protein